jgi:hypothetical protein
LTADGVDILLRAGRQDQSPRVAAGDRVGSVGTDAGWADTGDKDCVMLRIAIRGLDFACGPVLPLILSAYALLTCVAVVLLSNVSLEVILVTLAIYFLEVYCDPIKLISVG